MIGQSIKVDRSSDLTVVDYIKNSSNPSDFVLMWGAESSYNFVSERRAPTRFVYQYPLYWHGYQNEKMIKEFLNDITMNKPMLIIDTSTTDIRIPPLDIKDRRNWTSGSNTFRIIPQMNDIFQYIDANYYFAGFIGEKNWRIYKIQNRS